MRLERRSEATDGAPKAKRRGDKLFAFMQRNATPATAFFQIPGNRLVELGTQVEI